VADDPYCYDNTDVLKNRYDIRDYATLETVERLKSYTRSIEPVSLTLSPGGISLIHHHLFQDIYPWAGEIRSVDMAKENALFCRPGLIEGNLRSLTANMSNDQNLKSSDPRTFAASAARHINELNVIHPFREGNGRTNRLILDLLAENAGYSSGIQETSRNRWMTASRIGYAEMDDGPMARLILDHIKAKENEKEPIKEDDGR